MPRPYASFIVLMLATVGFLVGNSIWFDRRVADSANHVDMATHTWKPDYDWQAENRLTERLDAVGHWLVILLALHAVASCGYALTRIRTNRWHAIAAALFAAVALVIALALSLAGIGGGMIG